MSNAAKVCILNYGSGNVKSVYNMVSYLQYDAVISNSAYDIKRSTHIILPGVGSFGAAMEKIKTFVPLNVLEREVFNHQKPFLGICVGIQVLSEKGFEHGEYSGLGWLKGSVTRLQTKFLPLPHIGWNEINIKRVSNF